MMSALVTSESVSIGHPDKLADQISDAIVDFCLKEDRHSHVDCETVISKGLVLIAGEITTQAKPDFHKLIASVIHNAGYPFDASLYNIIIDIHEQSHDLASIVNSGFANDQGFFFGYATDETKECMPVPIMLAHKLQNDLRSAREKKLLPFLGPDAKSLVTVEYDEKKSPKRIDSIVLSTQHSEKISIDELRLTLTPFIKKNLPEHLIDQKTTYYINPAGRFIEGGPVIDTGLTGRKQIVDTYGGAAKHGGGCFSGKDPTKMDRSGAYMARYIAKNIVHAKIAKKCQIQLSYAIGLKNPIAINIETFGTSLIPDAEIEKLIPKIFDLTPLGIIDTLDLLRPIYQKTAYGGHFGREDKDFSWEKTDKAKSFATIS
jgi:S-adenosylmethionine synthetase